MYQNQLISLFKKTKQNKTKKLKKKNRISARLSTRTYSYPTVCDFPPSGFYGLPRIHKPLYPNPPVVLGIRSVSHSLSSEPAKVLSPMVGNTSHHVRNSQDIAYKIMNISLFPSEFKFMVSFDTSALFTIVPVDKAVTFRTSEPSEKRPLLGRTYRFVPPYCRKFNTVFK